MRKCSLCGKKTQIGRNRSHAQNRSPRKFKANVQKVHGVWLCTSCIKKSKVASRACRQAGRKLQVENKKTAPGNK